MKTWRAFCNMLRMARRDPGWAFLAILRSPLRAPLYLFKTLLFLVVVITLVGLLGAAIVIGLHLDHSKIADAFLIALILVALLTSAIWFLSRPLRQHFGDKSSDTHGSARFATEKEAARLTRRPDGLLIGRDAKTGKLLRYAGPAHLLTMAPTRSGKGVGTIIPNLLTLDRSVICVDPKGENTRIAGRARNRFGPVHILDPFGITGRSSAAFNPLAGLDARSLDVAEEAATLADALVHDAPGEAGDAHWNEEAKALIAGIILYIAAEEPLEHRTLTTLRGHLTAAPELLLHPPDAHAAHRGGQRAHCPRRQPAPGQGSPGGGRRPLGRSAPHPFPR